MITEEEAAQYLDMPVRVTLADGKTFEGVYWDWQLDVSDEIPNAMVFKDLDGSDFWGGSVVIEAEKIASVETIGVPRSDDGTKRDRATTNGCRRF